MNPKTVLSSLIKNCDIDSFNEDLQLVKNASIFVQKGVIYIRHYQTIIFAYDPVSKRCECDLDCSPTSNRQIRFALRHFGIVEASVINVHDGSKMNYSGCFR